MTFPVYRLAIYAPRSIDPDEATVLTPISGHSDPFQVATNGANPSWKPYLITPTGRHGRIDPLNKATDTGVQTFELHDPQLPGTDPLARWFVAFMGNDEGRLRLGGLLAQGWESLDGGVTFTPYFAGRVRTVTEVSPIRYQLGVRELADDLEAWAFVGRPHASIDYAALQPILPALGQSITWGTASKVIPQTGTIQSPGAAYGDVRILHFDNSSRVRGANIVTTNLMEAAHFAPGEAIFHEDPALNRARVYLKRLDTGAHGYFLCSLTLLANSVTIASLGNIAFSGASFLDGKHWRILEVGIKTLPVGSVGYMDYPPIGQTCEAWIEIEQEAKREAPLFIGDIHPVTLWKHLLEGKFGYLWDLKHTLPGGVSVGDPLLPMAYDAAAFTALEADGRFPLMRFKVTEVSARGAWIEENILKACNLAYYINGSGEIVPVDLRWSTVTATVGAAPTVTDADLILGGSKQWQYDRSRAVTRVDGSYYRDIPATNNAVLTALNYDPAMFPTLPVKPTDSPPEELVYPVTPVYLEDVDLTDQPFTLDVKGYRFMAGELLNGQPRQAVLERALWDLAIDTAQPFGQGAPTIMLRGKRGSAADAQPGEIRKLAVRSVPDPATGRLGGTRAVRALDRTEHGSGVDITWMDLGLAVAASTPTLGVPTREFTNPYGGASVAVTLNGASDPVEVQYAVTATSVGSAPGATDPLWTMVPGGLTRATSTLSWRGLPAGTRIWVRGRSRPDARGSHQLPSAWVAASSPGYVDLLPLGVVSALASSLIGSRSFRLSWTLARNWSPRSEDFNHAAWTKTNVTVTSANTQAPNGQTIADKILETAINAGHFVINASTIAITSGEQLCLSGFGKNLGGRLLVLLGVDGGNSFLARFNLATGAVDSTAAAGAGAVDASAIYDVGGGWYWCIVVGKVNGGATTAKMELALDDGSHGSYLGDVTKGAYCWGAQFERSRAAADPYIKTLDVAMDSDTPMELLAMTPTTDPRVVVAQVPGGTTFFDFPGEALTGLVLSASTTYRIGVRHYNAPGSVGVETTIDVATNSTDPTPDLPHPPRQLF